jgi:hypothetical protein
MKDFITLGSTPVSEDCAQVGAEDYPVRSLKECRLYRSGLRKKFGAEPDGCRLRIKEFPHDFGTYREVVCEYDTDNEEAAAYALRCENEAPQTWADINITEVL